MKKGIDRKIVEEYNDYRKQEKKKFLFFYS